MKNKRTTVLVDPRVGIVVVLHDQKHFYFYSESPESQPLRDLGLKMGEEFREDTTATDIVSRFLESDVIVGSTFEGGDDE